MTKKLKSILETSGGGRSCWTCSLIAGRFIIILFYFAKLTD
nr:MAG TPA: hypothetical protein [Caudoviricetes sp.]